jgi:translation initiation factor IF-1
MDRLYRVCVKIFAVVHEIEDDAALFVPIFHEWIRDQVLDLVALDVADYAHVPESPGIMLVCHEASFSLDRSDGRFGLMVQRRTPVDGGPVDAVASTMRLAVEVAARLERDARISGKLRFNPSRLRVEANDRLLASNSDKGYHDFGPVVRQAAAAAFGGTGPIVERVNNDSRDRLAVDVSVESVGDVQEQMAALTLALPQSSV